MIEEFVFHKLPEDLAARLSQRGSDYFRSTYLTILSALHDLLSRYSPTFIPSSVFTPNEAIAIIYDGLQDLQFPSNKKKLKVRQHRSALERKIVRSIETLVAKYTVGADPDSGIIRGRTKKRQQSREQKSNAGERTITGRSRADFVYKRLRTQKEAIVGIDSTSGILRINGTPHYPPALSYDAFLQAVGAFEDSPIARSVYYSLMTWFEETMKLRPSTESNQINGLGSEIYKYASKNVNGSARFAVEAEKGNTALDLKQLDKFVDAILEEYQLFRNPTGNMGGTSKPANRTASGRNAQKAANLGK